MKIYFSPGMKGYATTYSADRFVDCNGGLVNIENDHINSTLVENSTQLFVLHKYPVSSESRYVFTNHSY